MRTRSTASHRERGNIRARDGPRIDSSPTIRNPMKKSAEKLSLDDSREQWRTLALFATYHLVLSLALVILAERAELLKAANAQPALFSNVSQAFLAASVIFLISSALKRPPFSTQVRGILLIDITLLTWLMHAAGGASSGYGLLLAVSLALGVLLTRGLSPIFFTALASTAVIGQQVYAYFFIEAPLIGFLHAGLLGLACLSIGLLNYVLSRRLDTTREIIQQQEKDLNNLNVINDLVVDLLDLGVIVVDSRNRIITANELVGSWLHTPITKALPIAALHQDLSDALTQWRPQPARIADPDMVLEIAGKELRIEFLQIGGAEYRGAIILVRDMARVRAESHRVKLAAIGQMSAGVAHEIRNPLSAISQGAQLLRESPRIKDQERNIVDMLLRNTARLNSVVDNILSLSRRREPSRKPVELCAFLQEVAKEMATVPATEAAQIKIDCPVEIWILVDPQHLDEVLNILVENAIRHGGPQAALEVVMRGHLIDDQTPVLDIQDNGAGVAKNIARKLFEPFFSTGNGTGLGLFLAKQLCEANGCRLALSAQPAENGARFEISLPLASRP